MPVSNTSLVERIARVIAGRVVSINAEGDDPSAASAGRFDLARLSRRRPVGDPHACASPTAAMAEAGDVAIWERMIEAALAEAEAAAS